MNTPRAPDLTITIERRLCEHPLSPEAFERFLHHVERLLDDGSEKERDVLDRGWF